MQFKPTDPQTERLPALYDPRSAVLTVDQGIDPIDRALTAARLAADAGRLAACLDRLCVNCSCAASADPGYLADTGADADREVPW